jgi:hypothetical protein
MPPFNTGPINGSSAAAAQTHAGNGPDLAPIGHDDWQRLGSSQRQQRFSDQYEAVAKHLQSIIQYADKGVQTATVALNKANSDAGQPPTPDQKSAVLSAERLVKSRLAMRQRLMDYSHNKAAPGMLDVFYLNQTRQHLGEIAKVLQNDNVPDDDKFPALEELSSRLDVCPEGTALNILECASQLHLKSQPNKFHAAYQQAREELINTHLLSAVRASHAKNWSTHEMEEVRLGKRFAGSLGKYKENKSDTLKSIEIHEVQSLKNALSKELGLDYLADRHISLNYEKQVGDIAKKHIPKLITTHAVGQLLAEKILARAEQLLKSDPRVTDNQNKISFGTDIQQALNTTLKEEFGEEASAVFEWDIDLDAAVLRSASEIAEEWSSPGTTLPQEAAIGVVTQEDVEKTIDAFFQADKLVHSSSPGFSRTEYYKAAANSFAHQHDLIRGRSQEDEEKRRHLNRLAQAMQDSVHRANLPTLPEPKVTSDSSST